MANDRTTDTDRRARAGSSRASSTKAGSRPAGRTSGSGGRRTRPPTQVVTRPPRPWGLIAAALAVVVFAVAVIGYAVVTVIVLE